MQFIGKYSASLLWNNVIIINIQSQYNILNTISSILPEYNRNHFFPFFFKYIYNYGSIIFENMHWRFVSCDKLTKSPNSATPLLFISQLQWKDNRNNIYRMSCAKKEHSHIEAYFSFLELVGVACLERISVYHISTFDIPRQRYNIWEQVLFFLLYFQPLPLLLLPRIRGILRFIW